MTPDEHASRAEELLAAARGGGRTGRRAAVLATAALAHAELALYHSQRDPGRRPTGLPTHSADRSGTSAATPAQATPVLAGSTLFGRLKGADGIAAVVSDFYRKVCSDVQLAHYFERTPMPLLQRHMVAFLVQATGGPKDYGGRDMLDAHEHLGITGRDFDRVAEHLMATLREYGIADADSDAVAHAIAPLRPAIVTQARPVYPA
jgi:hemoglobin